MDMFEFGTLQIRDAASGSDMSVIVLSEKKFWN